VPQSYEKRQLHAARMQRKIDDGEIPDSMLRIAQAVVDEARHDRELVVAVRQARKDGDSWEKIARVLRVTRQAARQRFGPLI
jgi:hypothetical protein